jgi:hypothetical protein
MKMNPVKTKAMIMDGGKIFPAHSAHAYERSIDGTGASYQERRVQKVKCELCSATVARQHLKKHQKTPRCVADRLGYEAPADETFDDNEPPEPEPDVLPPTDFVVSMPHPVATKPCPGPQFPATAPNRTKMPHHFRNVHNREEDKLIITEEGLLPRCGNCGLFGRLVGGAGHQNGADCKSWGKIFRKRDDFEENQRVVAETVFNVNGVPIETVKEFKYLGRILSDDDSDEPCVDRNLRRARKSWGRISRILSSDGASPKVMASFYKTIVQSVLLYGAESRVLSKTMKSKLKGFHRRCARYITGKHIRPNDRDDPDGEWTYPQTATVLEAAGLRPIQEYIQRRRDTAFRFASQRFIYRQCQESSPLASMKNQLVWWV